MKAYMFAGQGAQFSGMAAELSGIPAVSKLWEMADSIKSGIVDIMKSGSAEELNKTINTQPAMYLADLSYALAADENGRADAVCGFSVGEVPALAYAGAFSYEDGFRIILRRAELMQAACEANGGAMFAVIGLTADRVEEIAASVGEAWAVNYNAPTQTVVACADSAAEALVKAVAEAKGKAIKLKVSGAFHCKYMLNAAAGLKEFLNTVKLSQPSLPVYANLTAQPYKADIADCLSKQVCSPVLFNKTVNNMLDLGVTEFVEVGPGKVLSGLIKKITG